MKGAVFVMFQYHLMTSEFNQNGNGNGTGRYEFMLCIEFLVNLLILIVYFNLLGAQIPVLNNLQSWQLHDCLGSIEFCSNQCGSYDDKPNCCIVCDLCRSHVCQ